jgi:hypothetical protein
MSESRKFSLKTGRHSMVTATIKSLPATLPAGAYYLLAEIVDPGGLINIAVAEKTIEVAAPVVRLSASVGSVTPATISSQRPGSISITIANNGNIAASGLLTIAVSPSSDGATLSQETLATYHRETTLAADKHITIRLRLRVPATLIAGNYFPSASISLDGQSMTALGAAEFTV